jgi:gluconate 5-dehydrogenase
MIPDEIPDKIRTRLLDPAVMGPPIVWLASHEADDVHDERIVATEFENCLAQRGSSHEP